MWTALASYLNGETCLEWDIISYTRLIRLLNFVYVLLDCYDNFNIVYLISDVNECLSNLTCQNGGNCTNINGSYSCICTTGWNGTNCTTGKETILLLPIVVFNM